MVSLGDTMRQEEKEEEGEEEQNEKAKRKRREGKGMGRGEIRRKKEMGWNRNESPRSRKTAATSSWHALHLCPLLAEFPACLQEGISSRVPSMTRGPKP